MMRLFIDLSMYWEEVRVSPVRRKSFYCFPQTPNFFIKLMIMAKLFHNWSIGNPYHLGTYVKIWMKRTLKMIHFRIEN
ncbi:hypothetical protein DMB44_08120 [Thermoplasma sp. Kam2015]|nr:hypothetical protein DMB44_08120 [Thermoplasma sp. Kam2015]